jgi:hypothetical protein
MRYYISETKLSVSAVVALMGSFRFDFRVTIRRSFTEKKKGGKDGAVVHRF